ncbi:Uncharacterised protein g10671 [Pycnogonum litorale]
MEKYLYNDVYLTLRDLQVKRIPENFLGEMNVVVLSILNSTVEDIDSNAFVKQKDFLKHININDSRLQTVFSHALQNLNRLYGYTLEGNKRSLTVIKESDTSNLPICIYEISIISCGIESIEADAFTRFVNLQHLHFERNSLTTLAQNMLPTLLKTIDISYNLFSEVPIEALMSQKQLRFVGMNGNKVHQIPEESKGLFEKGTGVYLAQNPLECSCDFKWYPDYLKKHSGRLYGKCRGNNKRMSIVLQDLMPFDFDECE